ncbi:MAG: hypothetical protein M0P74_13760 [Syntrophales bacterium]|jgi:hypothetical protein|nr:hypothetical protein [Syntrophales bacterium]
MVRVAANRWLFPADRSLKEKNNAKEPIAKLPTLSFPRRFWAGKRSLMFIIQFLTILNHGCPTKAFGHDTDFCNYLKKERDLTIWK